MKSAFGRTGREKKKNSAGAAADWCPADERVKMKDLTQMICV